MIINDSNKIYGMKRGSPLTIGFSQNEISLSSDILGLPKSCSNVIYLEDNDITEISFNKYKIFNNNKIQKKELHEYAVSTKKYK